MEKWQIWWFIFFIRQSTRIRLKIHDFFRGPSSRGRESIGRYSWLSNKFSMHENNKLGRNEIQSIATHVLIERCRQKLVLRYKDHTNCATWSVTLERSRPWHTARISNKLRYKVQTSLKIVARKFALPQHFSKKSSFRQKSFKFGTVSEWKTQSIDQLIN